MSLSVPPSSCFFIFSECRLSVKWCQGSLVYSAVIVAFPSSRLPNVFRQAHGSQHFPYNDVRAIFDVVFTTCWGTSKISVKRFGLKNIGKFHASNSKNYWIALDSFFYECQYFARSRFIMTETSNFNLNKRVDRERSNLWYLK